MPQSNFPAALRLLFLLWLASQVSCQSRATAADAYRGAAEPVTAPAVYGQGVRQSDWQSAAQEQAGFHVPPGFRVELVACEPDIAKPLNMAFDHRGRLWVTCTVEYPYAAPDGTTPRDSIKILEDTQGDGRFDTVKTFADGLNIPIGLLPVADGAICFNMPFLWHFKDVDGDDRVDERLPLLGPFDTSRDTHGMVNALRQGSDGWIYACHGFANRSEVTAADGSHVLLSSGNTFRFLPDGQRIEQYAQGQVNPFGMTCDEWGNWYTADCHSKPLTALLAGACYPSFGRPHDGLGFAPSMMDHLHDSTAICGVEYYQAANFPAAYQRLFYSGNVMTSRINCNAPVRQGATVVAQELPDFMTSDDPWFRPVDIRMGPDGCLYVADFYNKIIGHYEVPLEHPERDRHSGRIWRIRYVGAAEEAAGSAAGQFADLGADNFQLRRQALEAELAAPRLADETLVNAARQSTNKLALRLSAIELLSRRQRLPVELIEQLLSTGPAELQALLLKIGCGWTSAPDYAPNLISVAAQRLVHSEAELAKAAVEFLGRWGDRKHILALARLAVTAEAQDPVLRHAARIAIRNIAQRDDAYVRSLAERWTMDDPWRQAPEAALIAELLPGVASSTSAEALLRYLAADAGPPDPALTQAAIQHASRYPSPALLDLLLHTVTGHTAGKPLEQAHLLDQIAEAYMSRTGQMPTHLRQVAVRAQTDLVDWLTQRLTSEGYSMQWLDGSGEAWQTERRRCQDGQSAQLLSSLTRGERYTGTLLSETFDCPPRLSFWLAGHNGPPDQPDHRLNHVQLISAETGQVLAEAHPPRSDVAVEIAWVVESFAGQSVRLRVIDGDRGEAFAWLAIGRFSDSRLQSGTTGPALEAIGKLLRRGCGDSSLLSRLNELDLSPRQRAGLIASGLEGSDRSLAATLARQALAVGMPELVTSQLYDATTFGIDEALPLAEQLSRATTAGQQSKLAEALLKSAAGCELLAEMLEAGWLNPASLRGSSPLLPDSLSELRRQQLQAHFQAAEQAGLDTSLVAQRLAELNWTETSASRGHQVFKQHCANCHQLFGEGATIGPQLDGAIQRGIERLAEDILLPNLNVDRAFRVTSFLLEDGSIVTGQVRDEDDQQVHLVGSDAQPLTILTADVVQRRESAQSLMPANLNELLNGQQLADLLKFLSQSSPR